MTGLPDDTHLGTCQGQTKKGNLWPFVMSEKHWVFKKHKLSLCDVHISFSDEKSVQPLIDTLPFHKVTASSWCSLGCPSLPEPPVDHLRALDTNATLSGELGSIKLNNSARCSADTNTVS